MVVRRAQSGEVLFPARALVLPLEFGRSGDDNYGRFTCGDGEKLGFSQNHDTLSREHFVISAGADGITLTDRSTNGVEMIAGSTRSPLGQGQAIRLPRETVSVIETCGLRFELRPMVQSSERFGAETLNASYVSSSGHFKSIPLGPDTIAILMDGATANVAGFSNQSAKAALDELTNTGEPWAVVVGPGRDGIVAIVAEGRADQVSVNRVPTEAKTLTVEHFDTIQVGNFDLRMLEADGPPGLECVNPSCRMLNAYAPTDNCKYCGTKLGEARTRRVRR